jgi:hypothetical protein
VSYLIQIPKAIRLKLNRCRALSSPRPPSACAVYVRTRPQRGLAGVFAFGAAEAGTSPMTSLADLLDPDQWMVSGKNLLDFPWPDGNNEREAMKLILSTRPLLNAHFERWSKRVMEALGRRGGEKVGDVFMEEYLRELWERSRASS